MLVNLNGWTRIGDRVSATGKWTVYRFKGKEFDDVLLLEDFPSEEEPKAAVLFEKTRKDMKRGAVWLVAPDGTVKDLLFIRPFG